MIPERLKPGAGRARPANRVFSDSYLLFAFGSDSGHFAVRLTLCGLVGSLPTLIAILAVSVDPPPMGVNVTAVVQFELGDAVASQALLASLAKSLAFA